MKFNFLLNPLARSVLRLNLQPRPLRLRPSLRLMTQALLAASVLLAINCAFAPSAAAQSSAANNPAKVDQVIIDGSMTEAVLRAAKRLGKAELKTDLEKDPKIEAKSGSTPYTIYFFGCTRTSDNSVNCSDILLSAAWQGERRYQESDMNKWNRETRFGKAYIDLAQDPVLELAINLSGGITRSNLNDTLDWWRTSLNNFDRMILTK